MEVIISTFENAQKAAEAADYIRQFGFKGEISIIGRHDQGDQENNNNIVNGEMLMVDSLVAAGAMGGVAGLSLGMSTLMMPGMGPLLAVGPISGLMGGSQQGELTSALENWGIPSRQSQEIKHSLESGQTVLLIKCSSREEEQILHRLQEKGAENIQVVFGNH